jgi:hypothetical protein
LADDEERTLLLIWKARVDQGRLRSWELVLDTAQQRRQLGLE